MGEEEIRENYFEKGLTYRELAKKHHKSFRDLARIIKGEKQEEQEQEVLHFTTPELNSHLDLDYVFWNDDYTVIIDRVKYFCSCNFKDEVDRRELFEFLQEIAEKDHVFVKRMI